MAHSVLRRASIVVLLVAAACGSSDKDAAPAPAPCPTAFGAVTADETGKTLAAAYRAHVPSSEELKYSAFWFAVALQLKTDGELSSELRAAILSASKDPAQADLFGSTVATSYSSITPACAEGSTKQSVISQPFQCTDDCKITLDQLFRYLDIYGNILEKIALRLEGPIGELLVKLTPTPMDSTSLASLVQKHMDGNTTYQLTTAAGEQLVKAAAIGGALAALIGAEVPAGVLEGLAAFLSVPIIAAKILALAQLIEDCKRFKADPANQCLPTQFDGQGQHPSYYGARLQTSFRLSGAVPKYPDKIPLSGTINYVWQGISRKGTTGGACSNGTSVQCSTEEEAKGFNITLPMGGHWSSANSALIDLSFSSGPVETGTPPPVLRTYTEVCPCAERSRTESNYIEFKGAPLCGDGAGGYDLVERKYDKTWMADGVEGYCHIQAN